MSAPFEPTRLSWYLDTNGGKIACMSGAYDDLPYGTDLRPKQFVAKDRPQHPQFGALQGTGYACSRASRTIGPDGDYPDKWAGSLAARAWGSDDIAAIAYSKRECADGTVRYHLPYLVVPDELMHLWPSQGRTAWGDVKSSGFTAEGWRADGTAYEPIPGRPQFVTATAGQLTALRDEPRIGGGGAGGSGGGHDGELAAAVFNWHLDGLSKQQCKERWLQLAAPRDPSRPFTDADFERHWSNVPARSRR